MVRVFVDVGAHYGETLAVALDPVWDFSRVYSLEPASACVSVLHGFRDTRLRVIPIGLSDHSRSLTLYGAGLLGASVYSDKELPDVGAKDIVETVQMVKASTWLEAHTDPSDDIYLKLNCEGSEADVLDDLLCSGAMDRVRSIYVDFDVRKIASQAHRQSTLEEQLAQAGVHYETPDSLQASGNEGVRRWLTGCCQPASPTTRARVRHALGLHRPPYVIAVDLAARTLPRSAFAALAKRFGKQAR